MSDVGSLLSLPGPQAFVARLLDVTESGRPVIVVLPDRYAGPDFVDGLRGLMQRNATWSVDLAEIDPEVFTRGDFAMQLCEALEVDVPDLADGLTSVAATYLDSVDPQRRHLIAAWELPTASVARLGAFLDDLGRAAQDRSLEASPSVIVLATNGHMPALPTPDIHLEVLWWWRVVHRLDTTVEVWRRTFEVTRDDVTREMVTEVSAWDLEAVAWLLDNWEGDSVDTLMNVLRDFDEMKRDDADAAAPAMSRDALDSLESHAGARSDADDPSPAIREAWALGLAQRWDGEIRLSPRLLPHLSGGRDELEQLVWSAQVRLLMPQLDGWREKAEAKVREYIDEDGLREWLDVEWNDKRLNSELRIAPGDLLEANVLHTLIKQHHALTHLRNGYLHKLVGWIRYTRNDLAHRRWVDGASIQKGRERAKRAFDD